MRGPMLTLVVLVLASACGGATPPPAEPEPSGAEVDSPDDVEQLNSGSDGAGSSADAEAAGEGESGAKSGEGKDVPEPQFTEGMSVNEAIAAVPPGAERLNVEQEVLGKPLQEPKVYEPCKASNAHFKLKVAVWDGRAVGVDVTTTPKNDKLAECLKTEIRKLTWSDKVKSLNTVEYQF